MYSELFLPIQGIHVHSNICANDNDMYNINCPGDVAKIDSFTQYNVEG